MPQYYDGLKQKLLELNQFAMANECPIICITPIGGVICGTVEQIEEMRCELQAMVKLAKEKAAKRCNHKNN